jgi:hypothetical protein
MWKIIEMCEYKLYKSDVCTLKLFDRGEEYDVFVNYKNYNVVIPMGIWGFGNEVNERNINFSVDGENGRFNSYFYRISKKYIRLFSDMIYFFLSEHNIDKALNDKFKITDW